MIKRTPFGWLFAAGVAALAAALSAQQTPAGAGDLGGVVRGPAGGEAGVWVIAETDDLDTRFRKIVVTADDGRFLVPDLPAAAYRVWVRGYGLADSQPVSAEPGRTITLRVAPAGSPREAATVYPANYWYSLLEPPPATAFPGTGPDGNGISTALRSQAAWVDLTKQGCQLCHQMGNRFTFDIGHLEGFDSAVEAWDHRVRFGQRGTQMSGVLNRFGRERGLAMYADWSTRIAAGEVPPAPPRPRGVEQNLVLTMWEWANETSYVHDEIVTDKRHPTVNAGGLVYGVSITQDTLVVTDTARHESREHPIPLRAPAGEVPSFFPTEPGFQPSPVWGDEVIFDGPANPHNPMMDARGRVWMTSTIRGRDNPDWCKAGSAHPSARYFPVPRSGRQISFYDPATESFTLIDSCYGTHHLQFAEDDRDTLWFSGDPNVVGWLDTRQFDETGDEQASQGWCPTVIDTNGDGRITRPWNEPGEARDPARDTRLAGFAYGIIANPVDGTAWAARTGPFPGRLVRLDRGDNPPESCVAEVYEPPSTENPAVDAAHTGHAPRGVDVDRNGLIWTALLRQRAPGQLRPQQVPHAERPGRDRPALPAGLDALSDARAADEGRDRSGQRGLPLLQLGGPVRHPRPRGERPDRGRFRFGLAARAAARDERMGRAARAVSAGLLRPRPRRAHRRSRRRLEGARPVGQLRLQHQLAHRGRQGPAQLGRAIPAPPSTRWRSEPRRRNERRLESENERQAFRVLECPDDRLHRRCAGGSVPRDLGEKERCIDERLSRNWRQAHRFVTHHRATECRFRWSRLRHQPASSRGGLEVYPV